MGTQIEFLNTRPNLNVRNIEASAAFYRDLLGFTVEAQMGDPPSFALLRRGGAEIALNRDAQPQAAGCYIYVRGVEALHNQLQAAGANITYPLTTEPWGLRNFVVQDPDGHGIAIGEWTGDEPRSH